MPVWKASREGIRERGKKRGSRGEGGSRGIAWYETEEDLYVESGCITPLCSCGYEVSSTFCFVIISALGIHLPNVANWLLKGVTYSLLVFVNTIHGGWFERGNEWSDLRDKYTAERCHIDDGLVYYLWSSISKRETSLDPKLIRQINANWNRGVNCECCSCCLLQVYPGLRLASGPRSACALLWRLPGAGLRLAPIRRVTAPPSSLLP